MGEYGEGGDGWTGKEAERLEAFCFLLSACLTAKRCPSFCLTKKESRRGSEARGRHGS